jgi:hypothetical protein
VGNHFDYRRVIATEEAIFKLTNEILNSLNNNPMAGIFCDLEKAFNYVGQDLLLSKLPYCGIIGKAKLLHESYLQNTYQTVQINSYLNSNTVSKCTKIKYGVPQGSILGPLLFLVYTNDLPKAIEPKAIPILFADSTSTLITSPNNNHFQSDHVVLGQLNKWFKSNVLSFQFTNKSTCTSDIQITYEDKFVQLFLCKPVAMCAVERLWDSMAPAISFVSYVALAYVTDRLLASLCEALWAFSTPLQRG